MSILRPNENLAAALGNDSEFSNGMQFRLILAKTVEAGAPVPVDLALTWVTNHTEYSLRTSPAAARKNLLHF